MIVVDDEIFELFEELRREIEELRAYISQIESWDPNTETVEKLEKGHILERS